MRVLVACEFSGVVRRAFRARGHMAYSCDLLPAEDGSGFHIQTDVRDCLDAGWEMMIAHPPCTYLTTSANGWHARRPEREPLRRAAAEFFLALYHAPIPRVCVENPVGVMSTLFRKPDQIVQPHYFGHPERKATCFWLRNLPPLAHYAEDNMFATATHVEPEGVKGTSPKGKKYYALNWLPATKDRWKIRSRTFEGVAKAMAEQWGILSA